MLGMSTDYPCFQTLFFRKSLLRKQELPEGGLWESKYLVHYVFLIAVDRRNPNGRLQKSRNPNDRLLKKDQVQNQENHLNLSTLINLEC